MDTDKFLYNGIDLRTSTVFDLTEDNAFLSRFLSPELGVKTKEDYLNLGETSDLNRVSDMLEYAEENKITSLTEKLKEIYKDDLVSFFNE